MPSLTIQYRTSEGVSPLGRSWRQLAHAVTVVAYVCSSDVHASGLSDPITSASAGANPCGPLCTGECFKGRCFYDASIPQGLSFPMPKSQDTVYKGPLAEYLALEKKRRDAPLKPSLMSTASMVHDAQRQPTVAKAQLVSWEDSSVVSSLASSNGAPIHPVVSEAPRAAAIQATSRLIEAVPAAASTKPALSPLEAENAALRIELQKWRVAGAKVAMREASIVNIIKEAGASGSLSSGLALSQQQHNISSPAVHSFLSPTSVVGTTTFLSAYINAALFFVLLFGAGLATMCVFALLGPSGRVAKAGWYDYVGQELGIKNSVLEISELQVGGLHAAGASSDLQVTLGGGGRIVRTKCPKGNVGGSLLRFADTFALGVKKYDQKGTFRVTVEDGETEDRLACLEVSAHQLLSQVRWSQREYFRFDLIMEPSGHLGIGEGEKAFVAMRIREVRGPFVSS